MSSYFRQQLESWLKTIEVDTERVVDIGGAQNPLHRRLGQFECKDYTIVDTKTFDQPNVYTADIQNFRLDEDFDVAFCLELMEYLYDPLTALKNINRLLKPHGTLYISFPFIYPLHPPTGTDYLRYTKYGAMKLLDAAGFEVNLYTPRRLKDVESWGILFASESWRYDRSETPDNLNEAGCLIKATKLVSWDMDTLEKQCTDSSANTTTQ